MLCDYHVHSSISADCEASPQEQIIQVLPPSGWRKSALPNTLNFISTGAKLGILI